MVFLRGILAAACAPLCAGCLASSGLVELALGCAGLSVPFLAALVKLGFKKGFTLGGSSPSGKEKSRPAVKRGAFDPAVGCVCVAVPFWRPAAGFRWPGTALWGAALPLGDAKGEVSKRFAASASVAWGFAAASFPFFSSPALELPSCAAGLLFRTDSSKDRIAFLKAAAEDVGGAFLPDLLTSPVRQAGIYLFSSSEVAKAYQHFSNCQSSQCILLQSFQMFFSSCQL